ncbi:hypothetical protein L0128_06620, partial [candidate division KSB1 bacterium]|nr:hypothetical protein [candidate division KSB1 bacterium]
MSKRFLIFSVLFLFAFIQVGMADYISKIEFSHPSPAALELGENLNISFNYYTTNAGGVRIFARPVTNGALTPGYSAHSSPLYPMGSGSGAGFFNIGSGNVVVDHVRFQMYNADQSQLILEFYVPVVYVFSAHKIYDIQFNPPSPTSIPLNERLNAAFKYKTTQPGGVRIFVRPYTNGSGTPGYAAHGSGLYPTGSGNGTGYFTITAGDQIVTHVWIHMTNDSQSQTLLELFVPVHYHFAGHSISNIKLNPETPTAMLFNQNVNIAFDYVTVEAGGVRIFARPFSGGSLTPNYAAHGSSLFPMGIGTGSGYFNIQNGSTVVDHIRFQMTNADQSQILFEMMVPVQYPYSDHGITDITFSPTSPAYLTLNQDLNFKFKYQTNQAGGVRIFGRPMTNGATTPGYSAHGSELHPTGSGSGAGFFNIQSGDVKVDHVRFQMLNADQSKLLLELFVPVDFYFGKVSTTQVDELAEQNPQHFRLAQNYPNPFNSSTAIDYQIPEAAAVELTIFNALGQKITTLVNEWQTAGQHQILWHGKDDAGKTVA